MRARLSVGAEPNRIMRVFRRVAESFAALKGVLRRSTDHRPGWRVTVFRGVGPIGCCGAQRVMSLITSTPTTTAVPSASPEMHRITVDEYERIIRASALNDPDRVELIDGYMVDKIGKSPEHGYSTKKVIKAVEGRLPPGWTWRSEQPVRIPEYDEPEPDVTIVRGTDEDYEHRLPGPADVGLLIEVSLTTLDQDRGKKLSSYASGGIAVYWIINLAERQVEVYTGATPGGYQSRVDFKSGQVVPLVLDGRPLPPIAVNDILPSSPVTPKTKNECGESEWHISSMWRFSRRIRRRLRIFTSRRLASRSCW